MNPVLVEIWRGPMIESFHRGAVVVVDQKGKTVFSLGDAQQWAYPRSAMKYFQHIPFLVSGQFDKWGWGPKELAILCASHNGETMHTSLVESMLKQMNLESSQLECGPQAPTLRVDQEKLLLAGEKPSCLHNNCSGKHTGFLAACLSLGHEIQDYIHPEHPLQQSIKKVIAQFYEMPELDLKTGLDGCSAPIFGMPLRNQALAYLNLIQPQRVSDDPRVWEACKRIVAAVAMYPELIAGSQRYCSDLVRITKGRIIGKTGADGIYSLAIPDEKLAAVIKIDDGKMGPQYQVAHQLLLEMGLLSQKEQEELKDYSEQANVNFAKRQVGFTRAVALNCSFNRYS